MEDWRFEDAKKDIKRKTNATKKRVYAANSPVGLLYVRLNKPKAIPKR